MSEMLLINPAPRKRRRRKNPARRTAAQRAATARMLAANRRRRNPLAAAKRRRRRRNPAAAVAPVSLASYRRLRRRRNPASPLRLYRRRRANPALLSAGGIMGPIQAALVQGAGAVAMDVVHGQIARFLPAALQRNPAQVGLGDAVKAVLTVVIGRALSRPTRGLSMKAATGSLTVQAHQMIARFVPANLTLGYANPGAVAAMSQRIGPNRALVGMGAYARPGVTPLLNRYTAPNVTPLLSGSRASTLAREGFSVR